MDALTVAQLAEVLQEPMLPLLRQVLQTLGQDRCAALLADTLTCEANGGRLTKHGSRSRTPGGVFLQLVKERTTPQERRRLFPPPAPQKSQRPQGQQSQGAPEAPVLTWDQVQTITQTLATAPAGEARIMKLTLIGRPGKVEVRDQVAVFRMQGKAPGPLPKGLPPLPYAPALTWTVMVALRQWNRLKDSVTGNQDDQLIVEGSPLMQDTTHVLMAQRCVSMLQQRAQKQAQPQRQAEAP
jgi:hypothetical protein